MRPIDADALMKRLKKDPLYPLVERYNIDGFINAEPTVDAVQVVHGRWKSRFEGRLHYCSKCGWALMYTQGGEPPYMGDGYNRDNEERWLCRPGWCEDAMRYCPQCGAKMDGKDGDHHEG